MKNESKNMTELRKFDFFAADLPEFVEVLKNKEWVYFGEDNLFPQYLVELNDYSALHRTCVTAKRDSVKGKYLKTENPEDEGRLMMANPYETVHEVFAKCAYDMVLFGGYAINCVWRQDRDLGIADFYHVDFSKVRSGKKNEAGVVTEYYYSDDWSKLRNNKPITYPSFNMNADEPSQIYYYNTYTPNQSYYPKVDYLGAVQAINIDVEIKNFHLSNIQNSLHPSMFINFTNGIPTEDQRDIIYKQLEEKYSGSGSGKNGTGAGALFVTFSEDKEHAPEVVQVQNNNNDTLFTTLNDIVQTSILTGHRINPLLAGIRDTGGGLGSNKDEILVAYSHYLNTVIKPMQNCILETFDKMLFLRDQRPIHIEVVQNNIIDDLNEE